MWPPLTWSTLRLRHGRQTHPSPCHSLWIRPGKMSIVEELCLHHHVSGPWQETCFTMPWALQTVLHPLFIKLWRLDSPESVSALPSAWLDLSELCIPLTHSEPSDCSFISLSYILYLLLLDGMPSPHGYSNFLNESVILTAFGGNSPSKTLTVRDQMWAAVEGQWPGTTHF